MVDEVIGVVGSIKAGSELVIVDNIIRPEIPLRREPNRASEPVCAAFISDIHVGSYTFLPDAWSRFIRWLNGKNGTKMQDWLKKIKYLIISGDVVDGIGVYPGQEADLEIPDIYAQYEKLANLLQAVPDQIQIIILPGNHDAVRPSEPQPAFPSEITKLFDSNIKFVGNPCYFTIHGVEVLAYHGRSMDDFITVFPAIDISMAIPMMVEMLKRRHLAPIYGGKTPIAPEHEDYLLIDRIPDIFVTGHGHATAVDSYRNVKLINASTWQSQTAYQKMMNYKPDPAKVPIVDLQTYQHIVMEFK
jgi:DNA polymerase II small subunit